MPGSFSQSGGRGKTRNALVFELHRGLYGIIIYLDDEHGSPQAAWQLRSIVYCLMNRHKAAKAATSYSEKGVGSRLKEVSYIVNEEMNPTRRASGAYDWSV